MTNNELLLAMSEMMDTKLKSALQPLKNDMQDMKNDIQILKNDVQVLKSEMQDVKNDVQILKNDVQVLKSEMQDVKDDVQILKNDVQVLKSEMQVVNDELHKVKICQENVMLPRLDTIESCYTDTYHRYRNNADKMEAVVDDVDLLKRVVSEHSEKLQKIG